MSKKANLLFWICVLSTLAAVGVHTYLTQHHYNFKYGMVLADSACNVNETVNCNATTASSYSEVLGVPIAIPGALINFLLFILLIAWRFNLISEKNSKGTAGTIRLIALGIFAVSIIMAFISYGLLHTVCPFCTAAYVISLITLVTAWMITMGSPLVSSSQLVTYGVITAVVAAGSFLTHKNFMRKTGGDQIVKMLDIQVDEWNRTGAKTIETASPLVMNPSENAKMKVVEFADFLCGHCANAYPILHTFMKSHPDVEFSFQAFPLDGACNAAIEYSEGTRCLLAQISQCAGQQGDPWTTQSWIFENQRDLISKDMVTAAIKEKAPQLGLNLEELMACVESEETKEIIRSQAQKGVDAGVRGTPSVYVNGKKVPGGLSNQILERIYQETKKN